MKKIFFVLICVISIGAKGQNIFPVKFAGCTTDRFQLESKIIAPADKDSLLYSIVSSLDKDIVDELRGELYIQVIIDTTGSPCCLSIENKSNSSIGRLHIDEVINNNTKWSKPDVYEDAGNRLKVAAVITLKFDKKKIYFKRLGYNGKTGWKELESCSMNKEEIKLI